jgi:cyanophycin synthetase
MQPELKIEPKAKPGKCSFCADAPASHPVFFFGNFLSNFFDDQMLWVSRRAPTFLKNFIDWLIISFFKVLTFLRLAGFSSDPERARTFRSRVIWEEAERRGIKMEQLFVFGKPLDHYRARLGEEDIYFESIPVPPRFPEVKRNWDDKLLLKREFSQVGIPVPRHFEISLFHWRQWLNGPEEIFSKLEKPVIVKPKVGSRGRHTLVGIYDLLEFKKGIKIARQISPYLVAEEHLPGNVCRATLVDGKLAGFYRGQAPSVVGDGRQTILELIEEKDRNRPERVEPVRRGAELESHLARSGHKLGDILPEGKTLILSHRIGRLFGGSTEEMIERLHPSFVPVLEKAAKVTGLAVVGFDAIIPEPERDARGQKWGIIECNTLPFIDLHYFALSGKPRNIAGMIWDLWE